MATDQGPAVQSALLRAELTRLRKDRGLTQEQVAEALDWSPSKVIRVEGGRSSVTLVDLDALLNRYGVTSESQRERIQALGRGARERAWWARYKGEDLSPTYLEYVGFEAGTACLRQYTGGWVPGLLQTQAYAEVLLTIAIDATEGTTALKLRMERQAQLARRSESPRQHYVIDEAVVRRHVGVKRHPAIMPEQLRHIADRAENDELITVQVIPFGEGAHPGLSGSFTLLGFDGPLSDLLYLDAERKISLLTGSDERAARYADDFEVLVETALPATQSVDFLRQAAEEMSRPLLGA